MAASNADSTRQIAEKAVEVVSWDPADHTDLPGFAHGLTRFGAHWMDVGISVIPVDVDPLQALDKVFERLREIVARDAPEVEFFTIDLRVALHTALGGRRRTKPLPRCGMVIAEDFRAAPAVVDDLWPWPATSSVT